MTLNVKQLNCLNLMIITSAIERIGMQFNCSILNGETINCMTLNVKQLNSLNLMIIISVRPLRPEAAMSQASSNVELPPGDDG